MAFVVPTKDNHSSYCSDTLKIYDEDDYADQFRDSQALRLQHQEQPHPVVTSKLYLKSTQSPGKLEKDEVVRSIRHRRRMNKARAFVQKLLAPARDEAEPISPHNKRWLDDAFSAP